VTVTVSKGRVRPLLYRSSIAAYDARLHRAAFVVTGAPAARSGATAEHIPGAVVRGTFGPPARVYRFAGFTVDVWDVNLLTKMHEKAAGSGQCSQSHMLEGSPDAAC